MSNLGGCMIKTIVVNVATTWISVSVYRNGILPDTHFSIADFIRRVLYEREWNPKLKYVEIVSKYLWYDIVHGELRMPRYSLDSFIEYMEAYDFEVEQHIVEPIVPQSVEMHLRDGIKPREEQVEAADFLINNKIGFRPLALRPGFGKTFLSINSIVKIGYRAIIVLGQLIDQWLNSIFQFTTLTKDDIYIVRGFDSLKDLWTMIDNGYKPAIILFSTRTLDLYTIENAEGYNTLRSYEELCTVLGIGIKVIDECHLKFGTNSQIDFRSNIKVNIYLSATYQRTSRDGKRIFDMYFPAELKYGEQLVKRYTTVEFAFYHLNIFREHLSRFKTAKGYNHMLYENYLVRQRKYLKLFVNCVVTPMLYQYFFNVRKIGQHCLILCQTRKFALALSDALIKKVDESETVSVFLSGDKTYGNEEILKSNIIVSTIKSCGTGRDIKGLKTCINTVSMASVPQTIQCLGRLRELPDEDTYYIDMCNEEVPSQVNHARIRLDIFKDKAKLVESFKLM